jgi:ferredoxin
MAHELAINWTTCQGHGLCAALLPERIAMDEWGYPVIAVDAVTPADLKNVRRAVAACPALALRVASAPRPARTR